MAKLTRDEVCCAMVLQDKGQSVRGIARQLGVAESTLRERLERERSGAVDGRREQPSACDPYAAVIAAWLARQEELTQADLPQEPIKALLGCLRVEHGFAGSYASVWRYVHKRMASGKVRAIRRVETAPGAQGQVDWVTRPVCIESLGGEVDLHAFVLTLSHSRMFAVLWSQRQDLLAWLDCHNRALIFVKGVPVTVRIDNLKTGVASGGGPWAVLHPGYASYAKQMGFTINPARIRQPSDKGKVERRGRDLAWLELPGKRFYDLDDLQRYTDEQILQRVGRLCCPVTGTSVAEAWRAEQRCLQPLPPTLPEPFDVEVVRSVGLDCLVSFEGRQYSVPFVYVKRPVTVRGLPEKVAFYYDRKKIAEYPRNTDCRLLIDQGHYEGAADLRVARPTPLGELGQQIVLRRSWEASEAQASTRSIGIYADLVETLA
ncbi:MAG TPA: IS21 family transposase [Bryobacteraceae bacterium]|nr:IS21 family transposase [Bryobacteraceae bacterium]